MINGKYHYEGIWNHRMIIVDLANVGISTPLYEIMAMRHGGREIECKTTKDLQEAIAIYDAMEKKYREEKVDKIEKTVILSGKYAKLRDDLVSALAIGKAADFGEDGGTCNLDAPSLCLTRWNAKKVEQAAKEAGTHCTTWNLYGEKRFVFGVPTSAQANRRSRVSAAMCEALANMGYDTLEYSAMD